MLESLYYLFQHLILQFLSRQFPHHHGLKRKCQYFGHIIRGDGIQRLLMEGRINGRRGRGRPRTMWTDNIKEWTKMSYNDCIRVAQDRERWRSMTADLLTTDGT